MKKLLILIPLFLCSCERKLELTSSPNIVIDKKVGRGRDFNLYHIKVYNGKDVEWFEVSNADYKKIAIKDTLINFMIEK